MILLHTIILCYHTIVSCYVLYITVLLCIDIILCYYDIYYHTHNKHAPSRWPGLAWYYIVMQARGSPPGPGNISTPIIYIMSITDVQ